MVLRHEALAIIGQIGQQEFGPVDFDVGHLDPAGAVRVDVEQVLGAVAAAHVDVGPHLEGAGRTDDGEADISPGPEAGRAEEVDLMLALDAGCYQGQRADVLEVGMIGVCMLPTADERIRPDLGRPPRQELVDLGEAR